ncbi:MAG: hypothetical protein IJM90_09010 [Firmicutes bacterium]|nr:hypothetical protein [Bacillota bacterium]
MKDGGCLSREWEGRLTIEIAILLPVLFLLMIWLLRVLFDWGTQAVVDGIGHRLVLLCQSKSGEDWQEEAYREAYSCVESNGLANRLEFLDIHREDHLLYATVSVELEIRHFIWGSRKFASEEKAVLFQNASTRQRMDFIWEAGELLPGIGPALRAYQEKLMEWEAGMSG